MESGEMPEIVWHFPEARVVATAALGATATAAAAMGAMQVEKAEGAY